MLGGLKTGEHVADRQFAIRIRVAVPAGGFGRQLAVMRGWLDQVCGETGWASAPAGLTGVINDALAFYFDDAAFARAFVNRFCCGYRMAGVNCTVEAAFSLRSEASSPRLAVLVDKT